MQQYRYLYSTTERCLLAGLTQSSFPVIRGAVHFASYVCLLSCPYGTFNFAFHITLSDDIALIVQLLTATETQLYLGLSSLEIQLERNKRQALGGYFSQQL